jgi:predicted ATPase
MWTNIRLRNFRLFEDTGDIALAPLTFLIGPNSGGKSSLLKALLLLKQSAESEELHRPIVANGPYIELGQFEDYIFKSESSRNLNIQIGLDYQEDKSNAPQSHRMGFEVEWSLDQKRNQIYVNRLDYYKEGVKILSCARDTAENKLYRVSFVNDQGPQSYKPSMIESINKFYLVSDQIHHEAVLIAIKTRSEAGKRVDFFPFGFPEQFTIPNLENKLKNQLGATHYLSPLRDQPHRLYPFPQDTPRDVGIRGERAGDVMALNQGLADRVSHWAGKISLANGISIARHNSDYSINVINSVGHSNMIINSGTGTPQVLPILVQGFYAQTGTTLLIEQPESDLNPAVQSELSDFFVHLVSDPAHRKQLIIETHSEHFLNRVRTWIAKGKLDREMVAVYYCSQGKGGGKVKRLTINDHGQFENWPKGFFTQEIDEAMAQTRAVFKRANRKAKPSR